MPLLLIHLFNKYFWNTMRWRSSGKCWHDRTRSPLRVRGKLGSGGQPVSTYWAGLGSAPEFPEQRSCHWTHRQGCWAPGRARTRPTGSVAGSPALSGDQRRAHQRRIVRADFGSESHSQREGRACARWWWGVNPGNTRSLVCPAKWGDGELGDPGASGEHHPPEHPAARRLPRALGLQSSLTIRCPGEHLQGRHTLRPKWKAQYVSLQTRGCRGLGVRPQRLYVSSAPMFPSRISAQPTPDPNFWPRVPVFSDFLRWSTFQLYFGPSGSFSKPGVLRWLRLL